MLSEDWRKSTAEDAVLGWVEADTRMYFPQELNALMKYNGTFVDA